MTPINRVLSIFFITAASVLPLVGLIKESFANALSIEQRASNTDQIQLEWPSQTGMAYSIYQVNLLSRLSRSIRECASHPTPKYMVGRQSFFKRDFKVQAYGEAPSAINANYDF